MNTTTLSSSECSSGCESGWTMYLDQSSNSADQFRHLKSANLEDYYYKREDEDEDLSMVSDASSGPPHFQEDHHEEFYNPAGTGYFCNPSSSSAASAYEQTNTTNMTKKKAKQHRPKQQQQQQHHCSYNLDDTATSSPYQQYMGLPQFEASREQALGLSENHFKGQSSLKKHFGFFKSSASRKSGEAGGRR